MRRNAAFGFYSNPAAPPEYSLGNNLPFDGVMGKLRVSASEAGTFVVSKEVAYEDVDCALLLFVRHALRGRSW
ncbi:hypothetical protein GCM10007862_35310 [Dyella lipolytica]|nr:hypothetical protein GCM10007862_35310 [Dyella lipolytica]